MICPDIRRVGAVQERLGKSIADSRRWPENNARTLPNAAAWVTDRDREHKGRSALASAERARNLVLAEAHHRVANALQLVCNLLVMQSRLPGRPSGLAAELTAAAARVQAVAAVQRRLYASAAAGDVLGSGSDDDARTFLGGLLGELSAAFLGGGKAGPAAEVALEVEAGLQPQTGAYAALGLVTAELVTNALKHGGRHVSVWLRRAAPGALELRVEDDGTGFPDDFDPARPSGLGLRVVAAHALGGAAGICIDHEAAGGRISVTLAG